MKTPVIITGAAGKMGREAVKAVAQSRDFALYGAVTHATGLGEDAGHFAGLKQPLGVTLVSTLNSVLAAMPREVQERAILLELTREQAAYEHCVSALEYALPAVVGATGLSTEQLQDLASRAQAQELGVLIAPNFSIGAILMMHFAQQAAAHFEWAEIIELHHEKKTDAPSGTARKTAQMIADQQPQLKQASSEFAARGELVDGVPVHSVRLPGLLAHQEVIFGGLGQTLSLRHDSLDRASFMPGLLLALRQVQALKGYLYGLENILLKKPKTETE